MSSSAAASSSCETARFGRPLAPPPLDGPVGQGSSVQRGVLRQALVVSAPPGEKGSFVCDTFVACIEDIFDPAHAAAAARLLHARASLAGLDPRLAAVICLHGGGQTRHTWRNTAEQLARALPVVVITVDLRGHGDSFCECRSAHDARLGVLSCSMAHCVCAVLDYAASPLRRGRQL